MTNFSFIFALAFWGTVALGNDEIRINCGGGEYEDGQGHIWEADRDYRDGHLSSSNRAISGTEDDALYQTGRWGDFSYEIEVENGYYDVNLLFSENYWK